MLSQHINKIEEEDGNKHEMDDVDNISINCMTSDGASPVYRNESGKLASPSTLIDQEPRHTTLSSFKLNKVQSEPAEPEETKADATPLVKEELPSSSEKKKFKVRFDEAY